MKIREKLARKLCESQGIDPDYEAVGIGRKVPEGERYFLWEYWADNYVDIILEERNRLLEDEL